MMAGTVGTANFVPRTRLYGWKLHAIRAIWLVLAACTLLVYAAHLRDHLIEFGYGIFNWAVNDSHPSVAPLVTLQAYATYALILSLLATAACFAVAALLFWRRSDDWMALLVALMLLFFPLLFNFAGYHEYFNLPRPLGQFLIGMRSLLGTLGIVVLLFIFVLFPDGRFVPRWMAALIGLEIVCFAAWHIGALRWNMDRLWPLLGLTVMLFLAVAAGGQIYRYRRVSTPIQRQQTRLVVLGLSLFALYGVTMMLGWLIVPNALKPLWNFALLHLGFLMPVLVAVSFGIAMLRYGLWDADIVVRRTFVYGVLTAIVVTLYVLLVGMLSSALRFDNNLVLTVLATGIVALLVHPLRTWLQRGVNRFLYGVRYDPATMLAHLGARLEAAAAADQVLPAIVETVGQALKLPYVAVAVPQEGRMVVVAEYGDKETRRQRDKEIRMRENGDTMPVEPSPSTPQVPSLLVSLSPCLPISLTYHRAVVGELRIAARGPGERFTPADLALLQQVARQAGAAVHAAQLTADLQRSREQLVAAREEERRRLHRDLHDGVGPQLAGLALHVDAARNWLASDPVQADHLLEELNGQIQATVADIRRLVYDLRPLPLDQMGLVAALQLFAARNSTPTLKIIIQTTGVLPSLPAAVEVAAYRIALEAITNTVRHARAQHCLVSLAATDVLLVEVADDGRGLPDDVVAGVGLASMQTRAEELGGSCRVERRFEGGTYVCALLPLARV